MKNNEILNDQEELRQVSLAGDSNRHWVCDGEEERDTCSGNYRAITISDASFALCYGDYVTMNSCAVRRIWKVALWPSCQPETIGTALADFRWGLGADYNLFSAMKSLEASRQWIAERYEFIPEPDGPELYHWRFNNEKHEGYKGLVFRDKRNTVAIVEVRLYKKGFAIADDPFEVLLKEHGLAVLEGLY
jgi:hypothetical protein